MENEEKNPYLFYFIIALIVLGFIAVLLFRSMPRSIS
jgi:hypothetical protein